MNSSTQSKIKIIYWSDYACPFCYIGDKYLESVLEELQLKDKVELEMKAYQLDENAPKVPQMKMEEIYAKKNELSISDARKRIDMISSIGDDDDLNIKFSTVKFTNTLDAHRLTKYIASQGKNVLKFSELLYDAYFTKNLNIADRDILIDIAEKFGIDKKETEKLLESNEFIEEVKKDKEMASGKDVRTIPHYIFNDKYVISGWEGKWEYKNILEQILKDKQKSKVIKGKGCGNDNCHF
ncbi:2-hydroxychromene-2-carboxylate isomerase family protein [Anaeromyces robustus]|uniref:2-hydroxychromene-2-carboxylate isomerase family protein n=1 Tax=Anaeromyces robustus TaxID=1754192 RepID=A0A1Y1XJR3_9FUNG|nr:2-hydroxychromene-2-carboxylate isomerase family protein [Anaeromyces robustus]|eukprot:ORX85988.1 2-hydroxychromene-2-carboxylate isomerase family protein [Anaeromyces robustus]